MQRSCQCQQLQQRIGEIQASSIRKQCEELMYKLHTTSNGDSMLVCQMTDLHLINMIRLLCKQMAEAKKLLDGGPLSSDPLLGILAPQFNAKAVREKAEAAIRLIHETLPPYVLEASLRGIILGHLLQAAYGRSEQLPNLQALKVLTGDSWEDDDDNGDPITQTDQWQANRSADFAREELEESY